jgi:hypothetical protein
MTDISERRKHIINAISLWLEASGMSKDIAAFNNSEYSSNTRITNLPLTKIEIAARPASNLRHWGKQVEHFHNVLSNLSKNLEETAGISSEIIDPRKPHSESHQWCVLSIDIDQPDLLKKLDKLLLSRKQEIIKLREKHVGVINKRMKHLMPIGVDGKALIGEEEIYLADVEGALKGEKKRLGLTSHANAITRNTGKNER